MSDSTIPLGWCLAGQHDSDKYSNSEGPCPVITANLGLGPCSCSCHNGADQPRGYIENRDDAS